MLQLPPMRLIILLFCMLACSASNGGDGISTLPESENSSRVRLEVPDTRCFVASDEVTFYVLIPTTLEFDSRTEMVRMLWSMECTIGNSPECIGTGLVVSEIEKTGRITGMENFAVDGKIVSIDGLTATIHAARSTFTIDAAAGKVSYSGTLLRAGPKRGYGEGSCRFHGAPDDVFVP